MRSQWKLPYFTKKYWNTPLEKAQQRHALVFPSIIGNMVSVYNGLSVNIVTIIGEMISHKFGEFSHSRIIFVHKRKQKAKLKAKAIKIELKKKVSKVKEKKK